MALIPLAWLGSLHLAHQRRGPEWWWLASAFTVSWLADTAAHFGSGAVISLLYPLTQASMVYAVLGNRADARIWVGMLVIVGIVGLLLGGHLDLLLRTVAWLGIVGMVWNRPLGRLRLALLLYFGIGWVFWIAYVWNPDWITWGAYQGNRLLGLMLFCWAALLPRPMIRVVA